MLRKEFTGMLYGSINKFEELLESVSNLNPVVIKGYDSYAGEDNYFTYGCACQIICSDMNELKTKAEELGIIWGSNNDGVMAYTNGYDIDDFKASKLDGSLNLKEEEVIEENIEDGGNE